MKNNCFVYYQISQSSVLCHHTIRSLIKKRLWRHGLNSHQVDAPIIIRYQKNLKSSNEIKKGKGNNRCQLTLHETSKQGV